MYINTSPKRVGKLFLAPKDPGVIRSYHQSLPLYTTTPLLKLDQVTQDLGVKNVLVKYEGDRLGLPSFKILGASWGTFRAIADKAGLPLNSSLEHLSQEAVKRSIKLVTATDGNHGRALARMAKILGIDAEVFVPQFTDDATKAIIAGEGATVTAVKGSYDAAVHIAYEAAQKDPRNLLIQDTAFEGYEQIPSWIVEGYSTMLREIDEQLNEQHLTASMIITPVGVGSLAQAVVSHYKSKASLQTSVITVEPESSPCLHESLKEGKTVCVETSQTIMDGMNCGTVSLTAWEILEAGVDASMIISDVEADESVKKLRSYGIAAGPCGAASLAALYRLVKDGLLKEQLGPDATVVLLCTEGAREYVSPQRTRWET
ncbi:tryptophan synthase beta subunit-like PLP-dependent enzyme [Microthyrium microscopicum]|uniref:Tryptophan synthase beta subunit-like PLP-dependent enzyme n=1 Tax=Microthyrium microscopicum TaxID=703497 RepID=A0A6A6UPZ6_9PEZI|nr:tryptophan synthase beta subunit-like PLP-dependent enzyme [Microthyrium microscopicum]